jgi:hypothetical protein
MSIYPLTLFAHLLPDDDARERADFGLLTDASPTHNPPESESFAERVWEGLKRQGRPEPATVETGKPKSDGGGE